MSFGTDDLLARLAGFEAAAGRPARYLVACSGGLDSSVLLHALAVTRERHGIEVLAIHVNHGLHRDAPLWAAHCAAMAHALGVDFIAETVAVDTRGGAGPEAAAREARYRAFARHVAAGDWLLSAHHRDDLAGTLLINLLRGSGPAGIAGIPSERRFAQGRLLRPLLDFTRDDLEAYARASALEWVDDPGNDDERLDRNYLSNEVMPVLERRWPAAAGRLGRSAELAREADVLLAELADGDLEAAGGRPGRLPIGALSRLSRPRQQNLLRRAIRVAGLPPAPSRQLERILDELVPARGDAMPVVDWAGAGARRFRDHVYLLAGLPQADFDGRSFDGRRVALGTGLGELALLADGEPGLPAPLVDAGLTLRQRRGGERIKPVGQSHTRTLKNLLHEAGVVPWMRDRLPLVYSGDTLVAVADLWLAADVVEPAGLVLRWRGRPALD